MFSLPRPFHWWRIIQSRPYESWSYWPRLKAITEVKRFLGVVQYWKKFIVGFSSIYAPLHSLTSVKQYFQWGSKQQRAFDALKEKISMPPVLVLLDLQQPFKIDKGASGFSMGAILMQGNILICYHFETFSPVVSNYPTYDK